MDFLFLHWLRPWWLLTIVPLAILFVPLTRQAWHDTVWLKACDTHLLPHLLVGKQGQTGFFKKALLFFSFLLAIIALAGPCYKTIAAPIFQLNTARVIVFDLSNAQWANDITPNRLTRARFKLLDVLQALQEGQTGLILFTQQPFVVSPLTPDTQTIISQVEQLSPDIMPVQGYQLRPALLKAQSLLQKAGANKGDIVVFTTQDPDKEAINTAKTLAQQGFRTDVLYIGTNNGGSITTPQGELAKDGNGNIIISRLHIPLLSSLAKMGDGELWSLDTPTQTIIKALNPPHAPQNTGKSHATRTRIALDNGYIWLWPLLILGLWFFRRDRLQELLS